jgi:hypothetical protein
VIHSKLSQKRFETAVPVAVLESEMFVLLTTARQALMVALLTTVGGLGIGVLTVRMANQTSHKNQPGPQRPQQQKDAAAAAMAEEGKEEEAAAAVRVAAAQAAEVVAERDAGVDASRGIDSFQPETVSSTDLRPQRITYSFVVG